jgi:biotin operon repressor
MSTPNKTHLSTYLRFHIGRERGITAAAIAVALGCNEREVRKLVTELREDGMAVCGHPVSGYFIAATHEEIEETCAFLRSRAMHSLVLESKLRGMALADLLGQLRLPT